jgi:transposase-like protein
LHPHDAARRFLRGLLQIAERKPLRITTDAHPAYRKAIRWIVGRKVRHRCNQYLNNRIEQDHRAIKQRYYPMRGFGSFASAAQFCAAFDELRQYFRVAPRPGRPIPLATQRWLFVARWRSLIQEMQIA